MERFNGKILRAWKDIKNYEGLYQVSTDGRVRSCDRYITYKNGVIRFHKGKEMKLGKDRYGYYMVNLSNRTYSVHRLVAQAFIPNPDNKPCIDHIDCNKTNNNVNNLRWVTHKENSNNPLTLQHIGETSKGRSVSEETKQKLREASLGRKHTEETKKKLSEAFRGEKSPSAKAVYCYELDDIRPTAKEWAEELNLQRSGICLCCKGKRKSAKGYHFRYATEEEKLLRG